MDFQNVDRFCEISKNIVISLSVQIYVDLNVAFCGLTNGVNGVIFTKKIKKTKKVFAKDNK